MDEASDEHERILMGNEFHERGPIQKKPCFPKTVMFLAHQSEDVYQHVKKNMEQQVQRCKTELVHLRHGMWGEVS